MRIAQNGTAFETHTAITKGKHSAAAVTGGREDGLAEDAHERAMGYGLWATGLRVVRDEGTARHS
jgi:hypothetical protein